MSFSLLLYNALLLVGLVWGWPILLLWLALNPKTRAGLGAKWGVYPSAFLARLAAQRQRQQPQLWFHAVSVGEFNAIKPLVADLKDQFAITITTTTLTGQTLAQNTFPDLPITYFPIDFRPVLHHAVHNIRPDLVILTETELWPNAVDVIARSHQIPIFLINGRISATSFKGYQRFKPLIGPLLRQIKHLFMQSEADANRVLALGAEAKKITVAGNIKFDLNPTIDDTQLATLKGCFNFGERDTVLVCASTHSGEDAPLLQAYLTLRKDFPELKLILAPRHPERRAEIRNLLQSQGVPFSLRSQLSTEHPNTSPIVVLDAIGELLATYRLSHLAIMGGSFIPHGGQNPLEPISQNIPVIFGPYMFNFAQITKLIRENHVGLQIDSPDGAVDAVTQLLTQPEVYQAMVLRGQKILKTNRGAKAILQNAITQHFAPHA